MAVNRFGQVNGSGDATALFLKVAAGEILTAFETNVVTQNQHMIRNIKSGKSAQFPATWKVGTEYHTPGAEILGMASNTNERVIAINNMLISHVFIADIDEAMSHFEISGEYNKQLGLALAKQYDINVQRNVILAAQAAATITGGFGGAVLTNAGYNTAATFIAGLYDAAKTLDEKDVPSEDRHCNVKPTLYYLLAQTTTLMNKDWGGAGNYANADVPKIAGFAMNKTNNLPTALVSGETYYNGHFANTQGIAFHKGAVGTVKLLDLSVESSYDPRRLGTLMVAKYAVGHGILRPECAVQLETA